jgi:uracil-DNA glycosylase family 4
MLCGGLNMSKEKELNNLYKEYKELLDGEEIVPGDGNIDARLLLVGEAPGKDEIRLGKPFVGMAGKNLNEFLTLLDIDRKDIYITNTIKYRLSKINPLTGRVVNRPATKDEINRNREYLLKEIFIIDPKYIVTLGNVPLKALVDEHGRATIGKVHGKLITVVISDSEYRLFPLYHPASIIYNRALRDIYMCDIKKLKELVRNNFI